MRDFAIARRGFIGGLATSLCGLVTIKAGSIVAERMTLERACEVLTKAKHRNCQWTIGLESNGVIGSYVLGFMFNLNLASFAVQEFEAIAIAEKYEREQIGENRAQGMPTVEISGVYRESESRSMGGWPK